MLMAEERGLRGSCDKKNGRAWLDIPKCILNDMLLEDALERINLNIPTEARRRLKGVARRTGRTESETARALLLQALDRAEREEFYRKCAEADTLELRERTIAMITAFEKL